MSPRPALSTRLTLIIAAVVLVICSGTGMAAGVLARAVTGGPTSSATATSAPIVSGTPPSAAATATPQQPEATATAAATSATNFVLSITPSSKSLSVGQTFTVTVVATTQGAPLSGLSCVLRAPIDGPAGLLSSWPAAQTTDTSGSAVWTLTVPSVTPGSYGVEVFASGAHGYSFRRYTTLTIS